MSEEYMCPICDKIIHTNKHKASNGQVACSHHHLDILQQKLNRAYQDEQHNTL